VSVIRRRYVGSLLFTARCSIVQRAVFRLHVVCPSVTLVDQDHISWKSGKVIARTISPTFLLFKGHPPNRRETWGNFGDTRDGVGKSGVLEHKSGNIPETRKDR